MTDRLLDSVFTQLLVLRRARLAHGEISGDTVLVDPSTETASLVNFRSASTGASDDRLDADLAGAMAAVALVVGADRAAASAARCLSAEILGPALRHLRSAGLDPLLVRALRGKKGLLDQVREKAATAKSIEVPKLVEPRRISIANLVLVIGTVIGGWALIGVLIDVTNSFDTIIGADWIWVAAVFVLANAAYVGTAVEDMGSVAGALQFVRVLALEVGNSFSGIAGGTAMIFATRVRFFQQQGYNASLAVSSSAVVTASSWLVKGLLFVISLPLAWSAIHFAEPNEGGNSNTVWLILVVVVVVLVVVGVLLAVPKLRRLAGAKLRPRIQDAWGNTRSVASSPRKVVATDRRFHLRATGGGLGSGGIAPRFRRPPQPGHPDRRDHPRLDDRWRRTYSGWSRCRRGRAHFGTHRSRDQRERRHRGRVRPASVHRLPAADLGMVLPLVASPARVHLTSTPREGSQAITCVLPPSGVVVGPIAACGTPISAAGVMASAVRCD